MRKGCKGIHEFSHEMQIPAKSKTRTAKEKKTKKGIKKKNTFIITKFKNTANSNHKKFLLIFGSSYM